MSHYTVFTMQNCPDCKNAKDLLTRKGLIFNEVSEFTPQVLIDRVGPVRSLPQIILHEDGNNDHAGEYHVGGYKDLVDMFANGPGKLRKIA